MVVIKSATYQTRCPFSKNLIKPNNKICLFTEEQFTAFKKIINKELLILFPEEIISLIIEKTNYEKLIGRFGHENVTHWTAKQSIIKLQRHDQYNKIYQEEEDEDEEEEDEDEDEDEDEEDDYYNEDSEREE